MLAEPAQLLSTPAHPMHPVYPISLLRLRLVAITDQGAERRCYSARVPDTPTLASQIRARAAELDYDKADAEEQRALRRQIADELGTITQNVVNALKRTGTHGGARVERTITEEHRCPCCKQIYQSQLARAEAEQFIAKLSKRKK